MRITALHPDPVRGTGLVATDVELDAGTTLADARPHLARVTGWPGWVSDGTRPAVDDRALGDAHRAGVVPLVPGAVLRPWPGPPPAPGPARAWDMPHVAVVAGPGTGTVVPVDEGRSCPLPGLSARSGRGRLTVRAGRGRRRARPGDLVRIGGTWIAPRAAAASWARSPQPDARVPDDRRAWAALGLLAPVAGAAALGIALHEPVLALVGLVGPLTGLAGLAGQRRHGPRPPRGASGPAGPFDDVAAVAVVTARAAVADVPTRRSVPPWGPGGTLAVVGGRATALAHARALALGAVGSHGEAALVVASDRPADWQWARWLEDPACAGGRATGAVVEILDGVAAVAASVGPTQAATERRLLVVAPDRAGVPAWCTAVVDAGAPSLPLVDEAWAQEQARRVAAVRHRVRGATGTAGPTGIAGAMGPVTVTLGALPGIPSPAPAAIAHSWTSGRALPLGTGAAGMPVTVDLRRDGPHALVAGTTGSGKSELLTTLVLVHALAQPPERLSVLLVDFKGGTGLGAVAGLPHVVDHVTDLDPVLARRVLVGLGAELQRRERIVASRAARDLAELDPADTGTPPRLLVVVDELRALADDVPDALPTLARLAAQGRSLGVHLVLATQRPAGAVPADLRANIGLRICLRVVDPADSLDVVDVVDASALDPASPGAALLRVGGAAPVLVRVARAVPGTVPPVRHAPTWPSPAWAPTGPSARTLGPQAWVAAVGAAAGGSRRARVPWLGPLPSTVAPHEVPAGPGLPVGLADHPERQCRAAVRWDPTAGHLLVVGGPRSGRTTTLLALAAQADRAGWAVHAVGLPTTTHGRLRELAPHAGSVLAARDAVAVARLLELLGGDPSPTVVLVDDLDGVLDSLCALVRGGGVDRLLGLLRAAGPGPAIVATAPATSAVLRHAAAFRDRLVLPVPDAACDLVLGVPRDLTGPRRVPGRAVHLRAGEGAICQVALPPDPSPPSAPTSTPASAPAGTPASTPTSAAATRGPVVVPLPRRAAPPDGRGLATVGRAGTSTGTGTRTGTRTRTGTYIEIGIGGDGARPVTVDLEAPLVVAGPPGSGRTRALDVVAAGATRTGIRVVRPVPGEPLPADPADEALLVVDDLDDVERLGHDRDLLELLERRTRRVVVAVSAQAALTAYRGPLATLLRRRRLVVLDPADPASAELAGSRAAWFADARERPPGRAVLLTGRDVTPVQVYAQVRTGRPGQSGPTSPRAPRAGTAR